MLENIENVPVNWEEKDELGAVELLKSGQVTLDEYMHLPVFRVNELSWDQIEAFCNKCDKYKNREFCGPDKNNQPRWVARKFCGYARINGRRAFMLEDGHSFLDELGSSPE